MEDRMTAKVVPFPIRPPSPKIDWHKVEGARRKHYPRVPKKAVAVLTRIMAFKPTGLLADENSGYIVIHDTGDGYPPDPMDIIPRTSDMVWLLDLLDRYGGELTHGKSRCMVRRSKKRHPVFLVQSISEGTAEGLNLAFGSFYEHFIQSSRWQMLGKELPEVNLMALLIRFTTDGAGKYLVLLDRRTAFVFFDRLEDGLPVEALLSMCSCLNQNMTQPH
jgi:hypothetical protein